MNEVVLALERAVEILRERGAQGDRSAALWADHLAADLRTLRLMALTREPDPETVP